MNLNLKHIRLIVGLLFVFAFSAEPSTVLQQNDEGYIYWGERQLKWSDFQGEIPNDSKFDALTHSIISLDFQGEGVILEFEIHTIFDPSKSWKRDGVDSYILKHEQGHFDITEYYARVLRKKLKTTKYKSLDTVGDEVKALFNESFNAANDLQLKYDKETEHSINRKKQKKWNKKIEKMLSSITAYRHPKLKVNISYLVR